MTTVFDTPLTLTMLSLQAIVRFSLMPETLMLPPVGGAGDMDGDADGLVVLVLLGDGPGTIGVELMPPGVVGGDSMIERTPENWCAATAAIPPARASMPTTMTVPRI